MILLQTITPGSAVSAVTDTAKAISDYGMTVVVGAIYIILSALMMLAIFKWFKSIITQIIASNTTNTATLLEENRAETSMLREIAEGLKPETLLRLHNLASLAFSLSTEQVLRLIGEMRDNGEQTKPDEQSDTIKLIVRNIYETRKTLFEPFSYRGKSIADACDPAWIERVSSALETELAAPDNRERERENITAVYDAIKTEFLEKINK